MLITSDVESGLSWEFNSFTMLMTESGTKIRMWNESWESNPLPIFGNWELNEKSFGSTCLLITEPRSISLKNFTSYKIFQTHVQLLAKEFLFLDKSCQNFRSKYTEVIEPFSQKKKIYYTQQKKLSTRSAIFEAGLFAYFATDFNI